MGVVLAQGKLPRSDHFKSDYESGFTQAAPPARNPSLPFTWPRTYSGKKLTVRVKSSCVEDMSEETRGSGLRTRGQGKTGAGIHGPRGHLELSFGAKRSHWNNLSREIV